MVYPTGRYGPNAPYDSVRKELGKVRNAVVWLRLQRMA